MRCRVSKKFVNMHEAYSQWLLAAASTWKCAALIKSRVVSRDLLDSEIVIITDNLLLNISDWRSDLSSVQSKD